jgi:hypothetical protein
MQIPGEALLGKLWETLADRAIGNLLKPWQIRREGRATLDMKREELLVLAQAERDAEAIRSGAAVFQGYRETTGPLLLLQHDTPGGAAQLRNEPIQLDYSATYGAAQAEVLRREVNVAKAILHAESSLEADSQVPPAEGPSDDWMYRWRDYAATVSAEELQLLWGRVLAGQVKAPGAFSVRFLNFLHNLDESEAQLISTAMPLVINDFICSGTKNELERVGLNFANLLVLQELGLLNGVEGLGLNKQFSAPPGQQLRTLLSCHGLGLGLESLEETVSIEIPAYVVTSLGQQLSRLGNFQADLPYLRAVGALIKSKGFKVELGTPIDRGNGLTQLVQAEAL